MSKYPRHNIGGVEVEIRPLTIGQLKKLITFFESVSERLDFLDNTFDIENLSGIDMVHILDEMQERGILADVLELITNTDHVAGTNNFDLVQFDEIPVDTLLEVVNDFLSLNRGLVSQFSMLLDNILGTVPVNILTKLADMQHSAESVNGSKKSPTSPAKETYPSKTQSNENEL